MTTKIPKLQLSAKKSPKTRDLSPVREEKKQVSAILFLIEELADECKTYVIPPSELTPGIFKVLELWSRSNNIHRDEFAESSLSSDEEEEDDPPDMVLARTCYVKLFGHREDDKDSPPPEWEKYHVNVKEAHCSNPYPSEIYQISTFN